MGSSTSRIAGAVLPAACALCALGLVVLAGCGDDGGTSPGPPTDPMLRAPDAWAGTWQRRSTPGTGRGGEDVEISPLCAGADVAAAFGLESIGTLGRLSCTGVWNDAVADFVCTGPVSIGPCAAVLTLEVDLVLSGDVFSGVVTRSIDVDDACTLEPVVATSVIEARRLDAGTPGCDQPEDGIAFGDVPAVLAGRWTITWTPSASCDDVTGVGDPTVWSDRLVCTGAPIHEVFGATGSPDALGGFLVDGDDVRGEAFWSLTDDDGPCTVITTFELTVEGSASGGALSGTLRRSTRTIGGDGGCVDEVICTGSWVEATRTSTDVSACPPDGGGDEVLTTFVLPVAWAGRWSVSNTVIDCRADDVLFSGTLAETWCPSAALTDVFFPTTIPPGYEWACEEAVLSDTEIRITCTGTRGSGTPCVEVQSVSLSVVRTSETTFEGAAAYGAASTSDCGVETTCLTRAFDGTLSGPPDCP